MKKLFALITAVIMVFSITACSNAKPDEKNNIESETGVDSEASVDMGAPVVENDRFIDDKAIPVLDIAGRYAGINYSECVVSIYTDIEEFATEVGNVEITNQNGEVVYSGNLIQVMDNKYEIKGTSADFTVYTDNEVINLDFYVDGKHADYFTMVEPYIS